DRGVHQVPKQRGGASRPPALDQSVEDCIREARADGEIPRRTPKAAKIAARLTAFLSLTLLLTACGGHKQARMKAPCKPPAARTARRARHALPPLDCAGQQRQHRPRGWRAYYGARAVCAGARSRSLLGGRKDDRPPAPRQPPRPS